MIRNAHGPDAWGALARKETLGPEFTLSQPIRQHGAIAIMMAVSLPVILGLIGLSLELAQLYNRKVEMQAAADAIAISAAKQLNGTAEGIGNALSAAKKVAETGYDWTKLKYKYRNAMTFSDAAITFGRSPNDADWKGADDAKTLPHGVAYVRVDTAALGNYGKVDLLFMRLFSKLKSVQISHTTVAGRRQIKATPLAICAMSADPSNPIKERNNGSGFSELTEYGFRRGISYNLLKLNPGEQTAAHYLMDPISLPPKHLASNFNTATVGPYVCTGTVELPAVVGGTVHLQKDFPIGQYVNHLNSRFDLSKNACNAKSAPPDSNIKQYAFAANSWMSKPKGQVAETVTSPSRLQTIADLPPPNDQDPTLYGPLWVFARPIPWASYSMGKPPPPDGYTPFPASDATWKGLYSTGPGIKTYPSGASGLLSPYFTQVTAPTSSPPGLQYRRVLNVPLLDCPVSGSQGTVVAMARFFMTVPADANGIYAEFAGITASDEIAGPVELYQ